MSNNLTAKQRLNIIRVKMPEQDPDIRSKNFEEVNFGLSIEQAIREAQRCLNCKGRHCVSGCPVKVSIPEFITALAGREIKKAAMILLKDNALPAICGRVCPQEEQCEAQCVYIAKSQPVAIGYLERFVADWALANREETSTSQSAPPSGKTVAIIGSGPAGLTAASELAQKGHKVTVFEALHDSGGVLRYGIPEFRLPNRIIDAEISNLISMGVEIQFNVVIGKTLTLAEIQEEFNAVFISNGAGLPTLLNINGENLKGVYTANEYLTRVNLMGAGQSTNSHTPIIQGERVAVIGAGNTAMDCVRTARRLGAERPIIVYRRSEDEMPARKEEVHHAKEEGVEFLTLTSPLEILGDEKSWVNKLRCQKMTLGEPDSSGRKRPIPSDEKPFEIEVDVIVNALGTQANPLLTSTAPTLELNRWGNIKTEEDGSTNLKGVYAGGDISRGGATVILAMGDGKKSAASIHHYLTQEN